MTMNGHTVWLPRAWLSIRYRGRVCLKRGVLARKIEPKFGGGSGFGWLLRSLVSPTPSSGALRRSSTRPGPATSAKERDPQCLATCFRRALPVPVYPLGLPDSLGVVHLVHTPRFARLSGTPTVRVRRRPKSVPMLSWTSISIPRWYMGGGTHPCAKDSPRSSRTPRHL